MRMNILAVAAAVTVFCGYAQASSGALETLKTSAGSAQENWPENPAIPEMSVARPKSGTYEKCSKQDLDCIKARDLALGRFFKDDVKVEISDVGPGGTMYADILFRKYGEWLQTKTYTVSSEYMSFPGAAQVRAMENFRSDMRITVLKSAYDICGRKGPVYLATIEVKGGNGASGENSENGYAGIKTYAGNTEDISAGKLLATDEN